MQQLNFVRWLMMFVCICVASQPRAQQCGYEHRGAILLQIIDSASQQPIRGLKVYLSYADGKPIQAVGKTSYDDKKSKTCIDEYLFWENLSPKIHKSACVYTNMYRQSFPNAGDHFICVVPTRNSIMAISELAYNWGIQKVATLKNEILEFDPNNNNFFIYINISDDRKGQKQVRYAAQRIRIPVAAVTDICNSHLDGNDGQLRNGQQLNPIQIVLKANDPAYKATLKHSTFNRYLIPSYLTGTQHSSSMEGSHTMHSLQKIELFDEQSLQLLQTIERPQLKQLSWGLGVMVYGNFYNEDEPFQLGFRIPAQSYDQEMREQQRYVYYKYNETSKLYELDSLLNSKKYTRFDADTRRMFATEFLDKKDAMLIYHYQLKDRKWLLLDTEKHEKQKPLNIITHAQTEVEKAKCYVDKSYRIKPVQYFTGEAEKVILDTFWIGNYGTKAAKLTVLQNANFTIPQEILPNQKLPVVYMRRFVSDDKTGNNLYHVPQLFNSVNDYFSIRTNDDEILSGSVNYMIVDNRATVSKLHDSGFNILLENGPFKKKIIHTFPSGYLKEYGEYYIPDSCRIGLWTVVDSSQPYPIAQVQTNKLFTLQLANADLSKCVISKVENRKKVTYENGSRVSFAVSRNTDSIIVSDGLAAASYAIKFDELKQEDGVTLYLLKPAETFLYSGQIKLPVDFSHQQYKIQFTSAYLSGLPLRDQANTEQHYFDELRYQYPSLLYYNIDTATDKFSERSPDNLFMILDMSKCAPGEKNSIYKRLEQDPNIRSVNLLMQRGAQFFNDNTIQIPDFSYKTLDTAVAEKAKQFGFTFTHLHTSMSHVQFNFCYKSKIVNEAFYQHYNQLCESLGLKTIWLNRYANNKPEMPEDDLKPLLRMKDGG